MLMRFYGLLVLCFFTSGSYAEKQIDLYAAQALVINQSVEVRQRAASDGLATVLVRLSGSTATLDNAVIQDALAKASAYLYQFSYRSTDKTIRLAGADQPATLLVMRFSQGPLEELLRQARLPLWSANRPDVLVWTASSQRRQSYVSADSFMGGAIKSAADDRGLPVVMPVLDLEDRSALSVARLWAMDEGSIRVAARRYDADAVLAGRFIEENNRWAGNFMLMHQSKTHYLSASGNSQREVATSLVNQLTDFFANIYAVVPTASGAQPVALQINNIADFADYAAVLTYLEKLPLVKSVVVTRIEETQLGLSVDLTTDVSRFLQTLSLDKKLQQVESTTPTNALSVSLKPDVSTTVQPQVVMTQPVLEFLWR